MTSDNAPQPPLEPESPTPPTEETVSVRVVEVEELFQGERVLILRHDGAEYTLRITRRGKLILTK